MNFRSANLDAIGATAFFNQELTHIIAETYDILYPEYKITRLVPVSSEAGPGAEVILWRSFDTVGIMKIISNYAHDLPRADVVGEEHTSIIKSLGGSYGWDIQEIRNAQFARRNLSNMKAQAARLAYDQTVNEIGWFGNTKHNLLGMLNQPNVPASAVAAGASGGTKWIGTAPIKTNDEIYADMVNVHLAMKKLTKGKEIANTHLLPSDRLGHIENTQKSTASDTTILQFFLNNHKGVTVEWVEELADVANPPSGASGPLNCMMIYNRNPQKVKLHIPQIFEQFAVQEQGLEFVIPTHARIGGVTFYYPLSASIKEGI